MSTEKKELKINQPFEAPTTSNQEIEDKFKSKSDMVNTYLDLIETDLINMADWTFNQSIPEKFEGVLLRMQMYFHAIEKQFQDIQFSYSLARTARELIINDLHFNTSLHVFLNATAIKGLKGQLTLLRKQTKRDLEQLRFHAYYQLTLKEAKSNLAKILSVDQIKQDA